MKKKQYVLELLQQHPDGVTSRWIAEKIGYRVESIGKLISRLRQTYDIRSIDKKYYFKGELDAGGAASQEDKPEETEKENGRTGRHSGLNDRFIEVLLQAGENGLSAQDLAKTVGVKEKNLSYHIYKARRKRLDLRFSCAFHHYTVRPKKKKNGHASLSEKPDIYRQKTSSSGSIDVHRFLDRDLLKGLSQIDPADMGDYLELLRKSTLYKIWGVVSVEVNKELKRIEQEAVHVAANN
jgi:hypothetical protein